MAGTTSSQGYYEVGVSRGWCKCHVMACHVMSCLVLSRLVSSRLVLSCLVLSCLVLSCYVMSCHVMSCHGMAWHGMAWHGRSCDIRSCHVTSCHVTSRHVMSCHTTHGLLQRLLAGPLCWLPLVLELMTPRVCIRVAGGTRQRRLNRFLCSTLKAGPRLQRME